MSRPVVLIADDDEEVALLLKTYLKPVECEVLLARRRRGGARHRAGRFSRTSCSSTCMMPKRSGWEVCQALKAVQRTSNIGVILVTGRGDVKDRLTGLQVGADDYLVKPFDRDQVVKRVQRVLERPRDGSRRNGAGRASGHRGPAHRSRHRPADASRSSSTASRKC